MVETGKGSGRHLFRISTVFLIICFFTVATAGPIKKVGNKIPTCSRHCRVPARERKFRYEADKVYDYSYKVEVAAHMLPSSHGPARLRIEALANVHVLSTCDMILKLREVRINELDAEGEPRKTDNAKYFRQELENEALRFAFVDGHVSDVCPTEAETTWALNVKRGFLSAFQNNMDDFNEDQTVQEVDVLGSCHTLYHTSDTNWFSNIIKKSRDLATCSSSSSSNNSSNIHLPAFSLPQASKSSFLDSFLSGRQDCEQTIDWNGVISSVTCVEQRHFRPLAGEAIGPVTKVSQEVKFLQKRERGQFFPPVHKRSSLAYDTSTPTPPPPLSPQGKESASATQDAPRRVRGILRQVCLLSEAVPLTTDLFYELVANLRVLGGASLRLLSEKVSGSSLCSDHSRLRKVYLDALATAGTEAAVSLLVKTLTSRSQEPINAHFLLSTLPFLPSITSPILQDVRALLDYGPTAEDAMLPVSSMVYRYCQQYDGDCHTHAAVQAILLHLRRAVGAQCYGNGPQARKIVLGLRAIGNAGQGHRMTETLHACLRRRNNPLHVRISAVQAFRRMACTVSREEVQRVFEDTTEEDSELRIAAYLSVMQCADTSHFRQLQRVLAAEKDTQVLSFVFTHLKNMNETRTEFRDLAEHVLRHVDFASKGLDRLQLSRNVAGAAFSDRLKMVSSLLWPSQNSASSSWFPRSLDTNLTLTLLGHVVDLAEVGVRGEGLEVMVKEVLLPMFGWKKSSMGPKKLQEQLDSLRASVYARILGHELFHYHLNGTGTGTGSFMDELISGKAFNLKAIVSQIVAEGKLSYSQNMVLMDQKRTVPTSSGLPLTLSLNGSMAAQLRVLGSVDFRQAFAKPSSFHVNGAIKPSGALRVSASMSLDAIVTRLALRMTGTVHTNTLVKGRMQIGKGRLVNVELDMPRDNLTLFDARTEMTFLLGNEVRPVTLTPEEEHDLQACTGQRGVRVTGLDLCGMVRMPKSVMSASVYHRALLSSPSSVSVVLHKRDTLSQYRFMAQHSVTKHSLTTQLIISTPKSSVDRTLDFCVDVNLKQRRIELRMMTPWKKVALEGSLTNTRKKREVLLALAIDKSVTHGVRASVTVTKDKQGVTYIPVLELRHLNTGPVTLSGLVNLGRFQRKVIVEMQLKGVTDFAPSFKGSFTNSKKEMSVRGTLSTGPRHSFSVAVGTFIAASGKLAGKMEVTPFLFVNTQTRQLLSLSGKGDYRHARSLQADVKVATAWTRPVSFKCELARASTKAQIHYRLDTEFKSSDALVSISARADVRQRQMLLTRLSITHDIPGLLPRDTISMTTKLAKRSRAAYWNSIVQASLQSRAYSQHNTEVKLLTEFEPTNSRVHVAYGYGPDPSANDQYVSLTSKMRHDVRSLGSMILAVWATAEMPSRKTNVELKASHRHSSQELQTKMILSTGKHQQTKAHLTLVNKSNRHLVIVGKATLFLPRSPDQPYQRNTKRRSRKSPADFQAQLKVAESDDSYEVTCGVHSGRRKKDFSAVLNVKKPVSHRHLQMFCKGSPYSKTYQDFEAELSHTMHPLLADVVDVVLQTEEWSEVDLLKPLRLLTFASGAEILQNDTESPKDANGQASSGYGFVKPAYSPDEVDSLYARQLGIESSLKNDKSRAKISIKGGLDMRSSFVDLVSNSWNFAHTYTGPWHKTDITLADNGDNYAYEMSVRDNIAKWLEHSGGKIIVSTPKKTLAAEFAHEFDGSSIRTTCLTSWSKRRKMLINLSGRLGRSNQTEAFFGDVMLKSPWKPLKDFRASVTHDTGRGMLRSKSTFRLNGKIRLSHQITFVQTSMFTDAGVMLVSPWTRKLAGNVLAQHGYYPMTCTAEVNWSQRHRVSVTGTADLQTWDDLQMSFNAKTTIQALKRISAKIVNAVEEENLVSEIQAHYGNHNSFSMRNVLRRHDWGRMRFRILSPLAQFRVLETGYQFEGTLRNLTGNADFRIFPLVKKIESSLIWIYDTNLSGKLRIDFPFQEFPYVQISTTSEMEGNSYRHSSVVVEYHPSQLYELRSKYTLQSLQDVQLSVKTPHRSLDYTAVQFHQDTIGLSRDFSVKVLLPEDQEVVVVGRIDMDRRVQGTFSVDTPFRGFETCGAAFLYSFDEAGLLLEGNMTTEKRSMVSHVALFGNNVHLFSDPGSPHMSAVVQAMNYFWSLQRAKVNLQISSLNPISLRTSEDFTLLMFYSDPDSSVQKTVQFDFGLADKARFSSYMTKTKTEAFIAVSVGDGHDYLLLSNATISNVEPDSLPKHTDISNRTPQLGELTILQNGIVPSSSRLADSLFGTLDGITFNVEAHAPFLQYNQLGFQTLLQRGLKEADKLRLRENQNQNPSVSVPICAVRFVGWTGHPQASQHGTFFNISHSSGPSLCETLVDIKTALKDADSVSYRFHSTGNPAHFSGDMKLHVNDKQLFRSRLRHVHNDRIHHSSVTCQDSYMNNITLELLRDQNKLSFNASTLLNGTLSFNGSYIDSVDGEDNRTISVGLGIGTRSTRALLTSTNVTFSNSDASAHYRVVSNTTLWNSHANVTLLANKQGLLQISGQAKKPDNTTAIFPELSEIKLHYRKDRDNFKALLFLNHSKLEPVDIRANVKYLSLFDMESEVSVKSPVPYATNLNLAVKSTSTGEDDQHALMTVGWAPYRQISVDLAHKHLPSLLGPARQTDIAIITPFQQFQNGLISIRRSKILTKMDNSVSAKVNGQTVLDMEVYSAEPSALGIQQPLLSFFQRSGMALAPEKPTHRMNLFVRWNLTDPDCKLNVLTEYQASDKAEETQLKRFSMNVTHPWKTLTAACSLKTTPSEISSEGEMTWDGTADKKIYYSYSLFNTSTLSERSYEGHCRLGIPLRTIAVNGSWVATELASAEHGASDRQGTAHRVYGVFFWDADKDLQKQLALTSKLTTGDRNSADVAVHIPSVSQTIRLKSDLALEVRDVMWNSTTSLSLSADPSKTLTVSSALLRSAAPQDGMDYTLTTSLTQPASFLDVGVICRAYVSESRLSSSARGWFVTTENRRRTMVLTGSYHRLRRALEVTMLTPSRNSSLTAEVSSERSYQLKMMGTTAAAAAADDAADVDADVAADVDADVAADVAADVDADVEDWEKKEKKVGVFVSVDPFHRSALFRVSHDPELPEKHVVMEAWYVNDTAVRAEVYRPHVTGSITDSALSVQLTSSTLLHLDLSWRPPLPQELKVMARETTTRLREYRTQLTRAFWQASLNTQHQILQKWDAVRTQSAEDLQPTIALLASELAELHELRNALLRDLDDAFAISNETKEFLDLLLEKASEAVRNGVTYTTSSEAFLRAAEVTGRWVKRVQHSEMAYVYKDFIDRLPLILAMARRQGREQMQVIQHYLRTYLLLAKGQMAVLGDRLHSLAEYDVDELMELVEGRSLWQGLQTIGAGAELWLAPLSNTTVFITVSARAKEMYKQGIWLHEFLNLNTHLDPHVESMATSLKNILMAEIRFHTRHIRFLQRSRFTVWEPKSGKIRAEVCLPVPVRSLWTLPKLPYGWTSGQSQL